MTRRLVAQVQRVVLRVVAQVEQARVEVGMAFQRASLRARGPKAVGEDAHRYARAAAVAIRAVRERAAAAEPGPHQLAVHLRVDGMARRSDLRARQLIGQVAARVGRRRIELQYREREIVELGHGLVFLSASMGVKWPLQERLRGAPPGITL